MMADFFFLILLKCQGRNGIEYTMTAVKLFRIVINYSMIGFMKMELKTHQDRFLMSFVF